MLQALDAVRGRKQVILLSGGFDQTALMGASGEQAAQDSRAVTEGRLWEVQSESRFGDAKARSVMDDMARAFAGADAVVHAVDVNGLVARGDPTESIPGMRLGGGRESLNQIAWSRCGLADSRPISAVRVSGLVFRKHPFVVTSSPVWKVETRAFDAAWTKDRMGWESTRMQVRRFGFRRPDGHDPLPISTS